MTAQQHLQDIIGSLIIQLANVRAENDGLKAQIQAVQEKPAQEDPVE